MIHRLSFFLFLFGLSISIQAQDVMVAMSKEAYHQKKKSLNRCDWIFLNEVITIKENGYLGLIHPNGQTLQLDAAGTYKLDTLFGYEASTQPQVHLKMLGFTKEEVEFTGRKMGGVTCSPLINYPRVIVPNYPSHASNNRNKVKVYSDSVSLIWQFALEGGTLAEFVTTRTFEVKVMTLFDEVLINETLADTILKIDSKLIENEIAVKLKIKATDSEEITQWIIQSARAGERVEIHQDLNYIGIESITANLAQVCYLFQEGYTLDALQKMKKLRDSYPTNTDLTAWYTLFYKNSYGIRN